MFSFGSVVGTDSADGAVWQFDVISSCISRSVPGN